MKKEEKRKKVYNNEKTKHGDAMIILFHLGDNYEAYYPDAKIISELLHLSLISSKIPLVNFSADNLEQYINYLLDAGHSVCVSEIRGESGRHILESL